MGWKRSPTLCAESRKVEMLYTMMGGKNVRKRWYALLIPFLLLAACGGEGGDKAEQLALDVRSKYLSMAGCTATVEMTADYGERTFPCTVTLDHAAGGDTALTLVEPELLKGVTARLRQGESMLEFDGVSIDTGPLSPEGLSPVDCIPFLLQEIQGGFISQWGLETFEERECLRLTTSDPEARTGEGTETTLWFATEDFALVRGEIAVDGYTVMVCSVTEFQWKSTEKEAIMDGTDTEENLGGD